ncbi:hypothetical protein B0H13DRAFT_1926105 [Mycena leptocephala]|nr:hypothetical protein B0H13DRAFT_1926105 [Mycena leptocephala]
MSTRGRNAVNIDTVADSVETQTKTDVQLRDSAKRVSDDFNEQFLSSGLDLGSPDTSTMSLSSITSIVGSRTSDPSASSASRPPISIDVSRPVRSFCGPLHPSSFTTDASVYRARLRLSTAQSDAGISSHNSELLNCTLELLSCKILSTKADNDITGFDARNVALENDIQMGTEIGRSAEDTGITRGSETSTVHSAEQIPSGFPASCYAESQDLVCDNSVPISQLPPPDLRDDFREPECQDTRHPGNQADDMQDPLHPTREPPQTDLPNRRTSSASHAGSISYEIETDATETPRDTSCFGNSTNQVCGAGGGSADVSTVVPQSRKSSISIVTTECLNLLNGGRLTTLAWNILLGNRLSRRRVAQGIG